jgi:hypothetical protein
MKKGILFLFLVLSICFVQPVYAAADYEVDTYEVIPSGDLSPGESVNVRCIISLTGEDETFPMGHELEAYTELDDIRWEYAITVNGMGVPVSAGSRYLTIIGWNLAYPEDTDVEVEFLLEGTVPSVSATTTKTIFRLQQFDSDGDLVKNGEYLKEQVAVNPAEIEATLAVRESELSQLRESLDDLSAKGVNTVAAEEKYDASEDAILKVKTSSDANALSYLTNAGTYMDEAEELLDEAWAQKTIDDAEFTLNQADEHLTYFKVNRSMGADARVISIKSQMDNANTILTLAKDKQTSGEYNSARIQAEEALEKASVALNDSLTLRDEIGEGGFGFGFDLGGSMVYLIIGAVLVVAGVVGVYLYRRKTKWDELG